MLLGGGAGGLARLGPGGIGEGLGMGQCQGLTHVPLHWGGILEPGICALNCPSWPQPSWECHTLGILEAPRDTEVQGSGEVGSL